MGRLRGFPFLIDTLGRESSFPSRDMWHLRSVFWNVVSDGCLMQVKAAREHKAQMKIEKDRREREEAAKLREEKRAAKVCCAKDQNCCLAAIAVLVSHQ